MSTLYKYITEMINIPYMVKDAVIIRHTTHHQSAKVFFFTNDLYKNATEWHTNNTEFRLHLNKFYPHFTNNEIYDIWCDRWSSKQTKIVLKALKNELI